LSPDARLWRSSLNPVPNQPEPGTTTTYLIPTLRIRVSVQGSVWAKNGGAKAHGKYLSRGGAEDTEVFLRISAAPREIGSPA
jgi:hypothetical protein